MLRKNILITESLWEEVSEFRFANHMETESEALRALIASGLLHYQKTKIGAYGNDEKREYAMGANGAAGPEQFCHGATGPSWAMGLTGPVGFQGSE